MHLKQRAKALKTDIPAVFIALKMKETPIPAKIFAAITIAYALSPIDLIPDFIPILGLLDDLILLPALVALVIKLIPPQIFAQCREQSKNMWQGGKPQKWFYALPLILLWILAVFFLAKAFLK